MSLRTFFFGPAKTTANGSVQASSKTRTAGGVVQAIEKADAAANAAQKVVEKLLAELNEAQAEKVRILRASQVAIQAALEEDQAALEAEKLVHQAQMTDLTESFQRKQAALQRQLEQLGQIKDTTVAAVQNEFNSKVGDTESRAAAAKRELERIQSQLEGPEQQ